MQGHKEAHIHKQDLKNRDEKTLVISLVLTISFMILEVIGGIFSGSLILIADAGHMLIDAVALVLALFAMRISNKPADAGLSYGYQRGQVIAAFINSLTLLATTIWIIIEASQRILYPTEVAGEAVIVLAVAGVLVNLYMIFILKSSSEKNINIRSALVHVAGDLLGYVGAIVAGLVVVMTGWTQIDPILSVIFALLITKSAWSIAKDSIHVLMEGAPTTVKVQEIIEALKAEIPEIIDVHHIHIWSLTPQNLIMTAHVKVEAVKDTYGLLTVAKNLLKTRFGVEHATIELEDGRCSEEDHRNEHSYEL